jgi:hypothetical protein
MQEEIGTESDGAGETVRLVESGSESTLVLSNKIEIRFRDHWVCRYLKSPDDDLTEPLNGGEKNSEAVGY